MSLEQIEKRKKELAAEIEKAETSEEIKKLQEEVRKLNEEIKKIEEAAKEKRNLLEEVAKGKGEKIEGGEDLKMTKEERSEKLKKLLSSEEYENAYAAMVFKIICAGTQIKTMINVFLKYVSAGMFLIT